MNNTVSVAIDAMSGDNGPQVTIPAALDALRKFDDVRLILVGDEREISDRLSEPGAHDGGRIEIVPSTQIVAMDEEPAHALRTKKDSSMRIAINLVRENRAQACISAGNTGALIAIARYILRTLAGIDRPAIATTLPKKSGETHIMDLGANVDCKAEHLFQFAVMGSVLSAVVDGIENPRVGLLNIGSEAIKGNDQIKEADNQLRNSPLNYIGYVEGNDLFNDAADVIIADGFVGNVALKTIEGTANFLASSIKERFQRNFLSRAAAVISLPVLKSVARASDPRHYNGASLLGLQGVVIKSHGSADVTAFKRAIEIARVEAIKQVPQQIDRRLESILLG